MTQPDNNNPIHTDFEEIDLREIFNTLHKRRFTIIAVTVICMLISGILSFFVIDPVYEASTVISVNQQQDTRQATGDIEDVVQELGEIPQMSVEACQHQVKSPSILQATIKELGLDCKRRELSESIKTENPKGTNLITITVSNSDPEQAASVANTIREKVVANVNIINARKMERSLGMMEKELLAKEEEQLKLATEDLKNYKLQSRSIEFLTTQLQQKNEDLALFQSQIIGAEIQQGALRQGIQQEKKNIENTPATITTNSSAQGILSLQTNGLDIQNGQVTSENLNEAYVAAVNSYNEKSTALAGTESAIATARQKTGQLEAEIRELEGELINNQIEEKKLQDEVDRREKVVTLLTSKIADLKITQAIDIAENNITTVADAIAPETPVKPKKALNIAIAAVLGLMLSTFAVFFMEYMRNGEEQKEIKGPKTV
ncbi:MAG: Wzz/FepE/Etk N-terminal domain-containing protein [Syntrophomonadaceae bacterium]|nr:Wzz/FepE/Etk N-terminal domain-containing protein [Syntrophomonadaceae bacterium]MDD3899128.1 Wzz/FepE/Etk N-terminal domain-containing protein [Syntrophomonadaceae bacterium]MDD4548899.1 Wzz/FepE/Etk N-terminal domain-containing protein [Syntrophomonadaceae bacterium]